ncbi:MAG: heparinase II/III family protein [Rhizomicrobium sp.]
MPELWVAILRRALAPLRVRWRRSAIYRQLLKGRLPDRIRYYPFDALPRRLEEADALLKGQFRLAGEAVQISAGSIFDRPTPGAAWAAALNGFEWLSPLSAAGGEAARDLATQLISEWLERHGRYGEPAWSAEISARRLVQIFAHGKFVIANSDLLWRSKLFVSLRRQAAVLARVAGEASPGVPRIEAAVATLLCCCCLGDEASRRQTALGILEEEIEEQIMPDGGHVSRSPEELLLAFRQIVMAADAVAVLGQPLPEWLRNAHDRMAPMLRFFRHGDGGLALFNGGTEGDARMVAALLARDEVHGQPFLHAPYSGYHRLAAGRAHAVLDCGGPPPARFSTRAHAACLAFEFGSGTHRIVVNCGAERDNALRWRGALRATAAHSTVTLADTSMASILDRGWVRALVGPQLSAVGIPPQSGRMETESGWNVEASHGFYVPDFGIVHQRALCLSRRGTKLTGWDRLLPQSGRSCVGIPFAVRFHIHPDVRISPAQGGNILLKLPGGEGWRFRHGGPIVVEESTYVGQGSPRRAEQLVLTGAVDDRAAELAWVFEQIGAR